MTTTVSREPAELAWVLDEIADMAPDLPAPHSIMVEPSSFTYPLSTPCELTIHVTSNRTETAVAWATRLGIGPLEPTDEHYSTGRREYRAEGYRWGWKVKVWYTVDEPAGPSWHCPQCTVTVTAADPAALVDASMDHTLTNHVQQDVQASRTVREAANRVAAYQPPAGEVIVATVPGPIVRDGRRVEIWVDEAEAMGDPALYRGDAEKTAIVEEDAAERASIEG